jgi:hypothetical protein
MNTKYILIAAGVLLVMLLGGSWFYFFNLAGSPTAQTGTQTDPFGVPIDNSTVIPSDTSSNDNGSQTINTPGQVSQTKIFQITASPVVGSTLIQTLRPTTTLARYIKQEDGHVYDLALDVPGALPRVVSNVTIPGGQRAIWVEGGNAAIMQYLDGTIVKSVYLGFPPATTSTAVTLPTRIVFLPDSIVDIAASPDGNSIAYLLKTAAGVDGYITKPDGTNNKKVFALPLSQVLISWPATTTLLAQTKSAAGVSGIVFSINTKSGAATSLIAALSLSAIANSTFTKMIYQSSPAVGDTSATFIHNIKNNTDAPLGFDPFPEKCIWGISPSNLYCAVPTQYAANYLDLWHLGAASLADNVVSYNVETGRVSLLGIPGSTRDGGVASDILEMALSPNEKYLSFTAKGSRSVWGVRLTQ